MNLISNHSSTFVILIFGQVHHIRSTLTLQQANRVIHIFSHVIHDPTLPIKIQTTSVRLIDFEL